MCRERFFILIERLEAYGDIHGVKVRRGSPLLIRFYFKTYEEAFGQSINLQKFEEKTARTQRTAIIFVTEFQRGFKIGLRSICQKLEDMCL